MEKYINIQMIKKPLRIAKNRNRHYLKKDIEVNSFKE